MRPSRRQLQPFVRRWAAGRPSATALAVALSAGAYGAQLLVQLLLAGHPSQDVFRQWLALDPSAVHAGQWWKFLTFGLLHSEPLHLLANMLLLYFAGREVEPIVGPRHFVAIYALGNFVGGLAHWQAMYWQAMPWQPLVGVSAGVAAVVVAFTTILPELEVTVNLFFVIPLRLRARHLAYALIGVSALCWWTLTAPEIGPAGMIAAAFFAWIYVRQLGFGNPLALQRYIFEKRQRAARLERMSPEQFLRCEIDPILEKIAAHGMKSLTRAERKILEQGRAKITAREARK
jgi:membrane associated rhomboid family serine protease